MKRRHFIKSAATGVVLLGSGALSLQCRGKSDEDSNASFGFQSRRQIPVAYEVDIVIVGGSSSAVAAAVAAARQGSRVFLIASEPYLGSDICGCYRLWADYKKASETELGKKIFGNGLPLPLHVKKVLDNELISHHVDFLYSSYVTDIISDEKGDIAGVVIANRSGIQAIKAKTVIDATPDATVARLAHAEFSNSDTKEEEFRYIVVGNSSTNQGKDITVKDMPEPISFKGNTYRAQEYTLRTKVRENSWREISRIEQSLRDISWDADQIESSDLLFRIPACHIVGKTSWKGSVEEINNIPREAFQPKGLERLFVLSAAADFDRQTATALLEPGMMIPTGEKIGQIASSNLSGLPEQQGHKVKGRNIPGETVRGDVRELLTGLRPAYNQGLVEVEATQLPVWGVYDVVVMGGGTAGAPAGVGASRKGARTLVLEYLHGLGGLGTFGKIEHYFDGYREGYTQEVDRETRKLGGGDHPRQRQKDNQWVTDWKEEYYRREIRKAGGDIWFGVLGVGAYVDNGTVKGVVVATPEGKGIVLAHTVIDSTGSADIAIAAGAAFEYTDGLTVAIQGAGLPSEKLNDICNNTDWTFIDDTDMLDVWRTFVIAKDVYDGYYDIGKLLQTRERRRVIGDYFISALDIYNGRTYEDTFSVHMSTFDSHGFTEDPFFSLKPPAKQGVKVTAYVPFRALLPKGLNGISVVGLGTSADRDAMPVIRMQACLQNQGYAMGFAAARSVTEKRNIRDINLKELQKELISIGNLPETVLTDTGNYPPSQEKIQDAVQTVVNNLDGLEILLWVPGKSIPLMEEAYENITDTESKLVYARILGMLGNATGWHELKKKADTYKDWDDGWAYKGMGQFGRSLSYLDSIVIALGRTKKQEAIPSIIRLAELLTLKSEFSHYHAIAIAAETNKSQQMTDILYRLLQQPGLHGHAMPDIQAVRELTPIIGSEMNQTHFEENSTRNNSLRELVLARALYKLGDKNGLGKQILEEYTHDLRGHYARHASGVLQLY